LSIIIGEFEIDYYREGTVWINREDGEGGEFSVKEVEEVIKDFFDKNM